MDKLQKCGQRWIKFDENNVPEYGFQVNDRKIEKFLNLSNKEIDQIVLPEICEEKAYSPEDLKFAIEHDSDKNNTLSSLKRQMLKSYFKGKIVISSGCFKDCLKIKQPLEVIVPFNHSLMIDHGAFDTDIKQKFILKNGMQIFNINRVINTYFDYKQEFWALIGRKEIQDVTLADIREVYEVSKFVPNESYNFEVDYLNKKPKKETKTFEK